jgi:branched-chain amino acid transport system substrate-binding protein
MRDGSASDRAVRHTRPDSEDVDVLHVRLTTLLAAAGALAAALAAAASTGAAEAPLVIAVEGPQSGEQASNGLDQLRGVRLAVAQLNGAGGLWDGRKVSIYPADDQGAKRLAKQAARSVIAKGSHFVIGPYNSSVGLANLSLYRANQVLPVWLTSDDGTGGIGATVQPMNSQVAPVEERYARSLGAKSVAMLVDDTANGAFTKGMATRLRAALEGNGTSVEWISVKEGEPETYYAEKVATALARQPDLLYVSTYFPEGVQVAKALGAAGSQAKCLMGLANVDDGFVAHTTLADAQRCVFSGVPAAPEVPSARTYVRKYRSMFHRTPGVWGTFTYDSARILFAAINRAKSYDFAAVERALRQTKGFEGATGAITIDSTTGYRVAAPVDILRVSSAKKFVIVR